MHFEIQNNGMVVDGDADINLIDEGTDKVRIDYRMHVRIGSKVFGKFRGDVKDFSGSEVVDRNLLLSKTLRDLNTENINGLMIIKNSYNIFTFSKGPVTGQVEVSYHGDSEYVSITDVRINALGQYIQLTAVN